MAAYWGIAAHSGYDMFSWYKYLSFPPLGFFFKGNFFLTAPFPDHCLLVPFYFVEYLVNGCSYFPIFYISIHLDDML